MTATTSTESPPGPKKEEAPTDCDDCGASENTNTTNLLTKWKLHLTHKRRKVNGEVRNEPTQISGRFVAKHV
jgi:hypothetical protein